MQKPWVTLTLKSGDQVKISKQDFARVSKLTWRVQRRNGSQRETVVSTISTPKGPRQITLGKFIMKPPKGKMVYPRRGGLDFRRENLILCTMAERQQMLPKRKNQESSSQYKGVFWDNTRSCWRADIYIDGKCHLVGLFDSEDSAAAAYNKSARQHFGDKAYQNQLQRDLKRRQRDSKK